MVSSREIENVCNFLKSKNILLSSYNEWLSSCIQWYNNNIELKNIYGSVEEYVCIQWMLTDLRDVQHACLPCLFKGRVIELNSKYSVQINWMRDIGKSCFSQLQTTKSVEEDESFFTEGEPKKSNWEPKQKRVLMMEITDGVTVLKAMEYSPIAKLSEHFLPGTKAILSGPIECRNGILLLKNDNISILGGEVEELFKKNSLQSLLSKCLNLASEDGVADTGSVDGGVVINTHRTRPAVNSNVENLPNSASNRNAESRNKDSSLLMMDEDDEFLCELPDEMLDCPEEVDHDDFDPSPILDVRTFDNNRQVMHANLNKFEHKQRFDNEHTVNPRDVPNKPPEIKKPKLFPSLEDLRPIGRESSSNAVESVSSSSSMLHSTVMPASTSISNSFERSVNQSVVNNTVKYHSFISTNIEPTEPNHENNIESVDLCDEESMDMDKYPQLINYRHVKVDSITKLKIRNGKWFCCGSVKYDNIVNHLEDVTFSNEVLETLFGIPASEVEVWRGEMSSNPSLKKKVNEILKAGQTKLKLLHCAMTLGYTSEECTPQVVKIDMSEI